MKKLRRQQYRRRRQRRLKLYQTQHGCCYWCQRPVWLPELQGTGRGAFQGDPVRVGTIDHLWPRAQRGSDCWANVVLSCKACNTRKGNELIDPSTGDPLIIGLLAEEEYQEFD